MDFATLMGLVGGFVLVLLVGIGDPRKLGMFIDLHGIAITLGGVFCAMLVAYPFRTLLNSIAVARNAFLPSTGDIRQSITQLLEFSEHARKEGMLALDSRISALEDEFLRKGLLLAIDGVEPGLMREILELEMDGLEARHRQGIQFFEDLGSLAPAFGLIGTLVGLVLMLGNMADPSSIGPAMAIALVTTFYGAAIANMVFIPIAFKLRGLHQKEMARHEAIVEGVVAIQNGENPYLIESKLKSFLTPDQRAQVRRPTRTGVRHG